MSSVSGSRSPRRLKDRSSKRSSLSPRHKFPVFYAAENVVREQSIFSRRMPVSEVFYMVAAKSTEKPTPSKATHALFLSQVGPTGEPIPGSEVEMDAACRMKQFMGQIGDGCLVIFKHRALPISFSFTKTFLVDGNLSCSEATAWMMSATPMDVHSVDSGCGDQIFPSDLDGEGPLGGLQVTIAAVDLTTGNEDVLPLVVGREGHEDVSQCVTDEQTVAEAFHMMAIARGNGQPCLEEEEPSMQLCFHVRADLEQPEPLVMRTSSSSAEETAGSILESARTRYSSMQCLAFAREASTPLAMSSPHLPSKRGSSDSSRNSRSLRAQNSRSLRHRSRSCDTGKLTAVQRQQSLSCSPPSAKSRHLAPDSPLAMGRRSIQVTHSTLGVQPECLPALTGCSSAITSPRSPRELIKRLSTIVKRKDSRVLNRVFGVPITAVMERPWEGGSLPGALAALINWLTDHECWGTKGIFRCSGSHEAVNTLKDLLDTDVNCSVPTDTDVIVVAEVLKIYLQELPIPLVPPRLLRNFINAASLADETHIMHYLTALFAALPSVHREALYCLLQLLRTIHDHRETSAMTSENLSICFGPILFQPADKDIAEYVHHTKYCSLAVKHMIEKLDSLVVKNARPIHVSRASSSYTPTGPEELAVEKGQYVTVVKPDGKLWFCDLDGRFGLVPESIFDNLSEALPQPSTGTPVIPPEYHTKSNAEFLRQFQCSKDIFRCLPPWKQQDLVKSCSP